VTVFFAEGVSQIFDELPENAKRSAARSLDLLAKHPRMYWVTSTEIGNPAAMRLA
jgi:hypothetical protein